MRTMMNKTLISMKMQVPINTNKKQILQEWIKMKIILMTATKLLNNGYNDSLVNLSNICTTVLTPSKVVFTVLPATCFFTKQMRITSKYSDQTKTSTPTAATFAISPIIYLLARSWVRLSLQWKICKTSFSRSIRFWI